MSRRRVPTKTRDMTLVAEADRVELTTYEW